MRPRQVIAACECAPYVSWVLSEELKPVLPFFLSFLYHRFLFPTANVFLSPESQFHCRSNLRFSGQFPCLLYQLSCSQSPLSLQPKGLVVSRVVVSHRCCCSACMKWWMTKTEEGQKSILHFCPENASKLCQMFLLAGCPSSQCLQCLCWSVAALWKHM